MNTTVRQEVNLLDESLVDRKPVLPAVQVVLAIVAAAVCMAALAGWMTLRLNAPRAELAQLAQHTRSLETSVAELAARLDARKPDPGLALEARRLEVQLVHLRRLADSAAAGGQATRLTAFVEGLGRQRPEGLWLTRILVANSGRDLALVGSALEPGLLPTYIESLGQETAFAGLAFGELSLARAPDDTRRIDFRVAAGCLGAPAASAACVGLEDARQ
jgi:hypothetical protein